jgi:DNA-binding transcriptional ArsR family regulator
MHVYCKYPACSGIRNSAGKVGLGLDVRGEGGYVVAPPSRTDKGPYAFLDRLPRAEPPEWLLEAARTPHRAATDEDGAGSGPVGGLDAGNLEPIPKGERGDTLFRIACSLRAKGCEYARILSELRRANRERCSPPIGAHPEDTDAGELEKIAGGVVSRYPAGDASPAPVGEVLRNVEMLFARALERLEWKGRGGPTDRAVYAALLITARSHGRPARGGVKVYISVRALALAAGTSKKTAGKALDRLRAAKLVYRASEGKGAKAGALILRATQGVDTQPHGGG